jgi:hypothetical protein
MSLGQAIEAEKDSQELFSIHPPEGTHPATMLLGDTERLDIDDVRIAKHWKLDIGEASDEISVLLETGDGEPLAVEHLVGDGRAVFLSLPCNTLWSNLPVCQAFVPLVQEWAWYLTQPAATHYNLDAGSPIAVSFLGGERPVEATITTPLGETVSLTDSISPADSALRYRGTDFPGVYHLALKLPKNVERQFPFSVRRDTDESNLAALTQEQTTLLTQSGGVRFGADALSLPDNTTDRIQYEPFWNYLLGLVVLLFIAEFIFTFFLTKNRYAESAQPTPVVATPSMGNVRKRKRSA